MRVYLSGPISLGGRASQEQIAEFTAAFSAQDKRLTDAGYDVSNPCDCPPLPSWEAYMRHGIAEVCQADILAVLPRWTESRGARLETFVAGELGIPVVLVRDLT